MVRQTRKPTKSSASDDDWKRLLATFAYYRILDDDEFREGLEKLAEALRNESASVYKTVVRMLAGEPHKLDEHDGNTTKLKLEKKALSKQQIAYAELDLLGIDLKKLPMKSVTTVSPDELMNKTWGDLRERTQWSVDEEKVVRTLCTQAERLKEGTERVQRVIDDYDPRRKAIKPADSVAWNTLFESTEQWGAEAKEIAERITDLVRHPEMKDHLSRDKHVTLWYVNVQTQQKKFRKRRRAKQSGGPSGRKT